MDPITTLVEVAQVENNGSVPNLDNDALLYAGSATWGDWQNHIPNAIRACWPQLGIEARLSAYIVAKSFTHQADVEDE